MLPGLVDQATAYERQIVAVDVRPAALLAVVAAAMAAGAVVTWRRVGRARALRARELAELGIDEGAETAARGAWLVIAGVGASASAMAIVVGGLWAWDRGARMLGWLFGAMTVLDALGGVALVTTALRFAWRPTRDAMGPALGVLGGACALGAAIPVYAAPIANAAFWELDAPPDHRVHRGDARKVQAVFVGGRSSGFLGLGERYRVAMRDGYGWTLETTKVDARALGPTRAPLTASRAFLRMRREVELEVGEDRADPSLSLAVGTRWVYRATNHAHTARTFGDSSRSADDAGTVTVEVLRAADHDGLQAVEIGVTTQAAGGEPPSQVKSWVYGWNGQTVGAASMFDGKEVRLTEGGPKPVVGRPDPDGRALVGYLPGYRCRIGTPEGRPRPMGPTACDHVRESSPLVVAEVFLFLATLGASGITSQWNTLELVEASGG